MGGAIDFIRDVGGAPQAARIRPDGTGLQMLAAGASRSWPYRTDP